MRCGLPAGALRGLSELLARTSISAPAGLRAPEIKATRKAVAVAGNKAFGAYLNTPLPRGTAAAKLSSARHAKALGAQVAACRTRQGAAPDRCATSNAVEPP